MVAFTYASYLENKAKSLEETFENYRCLRWLLTRCARQQERTVDFLFNHCNTSTLQMNSNKNPHPDQIAALAAAVPAIAGNADVLNAVGNTEFSGRPQAEFTTQCVRRRGVVVRGAP